MNLNTVRNAWNELRAAADEDAVALDLTTKGDFANKPSGAVRVGREGGNEPGEGNLIQIAFAGGDTANDTFTWKIYAWREGGPAVFVGYGTAVLGTQALIKNPKQVAQTSKFWADTIVVTASYWPKTVVASSGGHNGVATLTFDLLGYDYVLVEIADADGATGIEAGDVSAWYAML